MAPDAGPDRAAVAFARVVRAAGLDVPVGSTLVFARALAAVGLDRADRVYWTGRATLVRRPDDVPAYDRAFAAFWAGAGGTDGDGGDDRPPVRLSVVTDEGAGPDGAPGAGERAVAVAWSAAEVLRHKDFAAYSDAELDEARRLMAAARLAGSRRRSRRLARTRRAARGARPDLRRTVRAALATGGEPVRRAWRAPSPRPRRVVLLCDVSGSMAPYARALARFLHASVAGPGRVEVFAMGTRLTRLTRELSTRDPDSALAAAGRAVPDWSGGTRLGEALRQFNDRWGVRGLARGAVVVVLSDGWDRGDPALVAEQMARVRRVAHKVVWVNPLKASPGYAPLARGMAAALPHVDRFVEGHSLASLEALVEVIAS